jgi:FlaA1/EpsC-like NDP-sugar epimerase
MTRFMMSIPQAVKLVLASCQEAVGGETFVLKMPGMKIITLAEALINDYKKRVDPNYDAEIVISGMRQGEKLSEELMTADEMTRAVEMDNCYVIPSIQGNSSSIRFQNSQSSVKSKTLSSDLAPQLSQDEFIKLARESGLLNW